MLQAEVLIFEFVSVDGFAACSIVSGEITGLAHEIWNDTVECGASVAESFFTGAQCTEVFARFWNDIGTELHVGQGRLLKKMRKGEK